MASKFKHSPLFHSHTIDCNCVGVQVLGAKEHETDPAEIEQLHLIIIYPVNLDNCYLLVKHGQKTIQNTKAKPYLS